MTRGASRLLPLCQCPLVLMVCVEVCDFGIARFQVSAMTAAIGSIQYMAPEVFISNHYTTKSDGPLASTYCSW